MNTEEFNQLGAAEKYTARRFIELVERCQKITRDVADTFGAISTDPESVEELFLDNDTKQILISGLEPLEDVIESASMAMIAAKIFRIIVNKERNTSA